MAERRLIPLFPLQVALFPGEVLPLHIFEQRYREMIAWCLDQDEPFGVITETDGELAEFGCSARIRKVVRRYDDGRLDIETEGEARLKLIETHSKESYLTGEVEIVADDESADEPETGLREQATALHMKLLETIGGQIKPSGYTDDRNVSFRIAPTSGLDLRGRLNLLELDDESARLKYLVEHLRQFIPRVKDARERQQRVSSNGHFKEYD